MNIKKPSFYYKMIKIEFTVQPEDEIMLRDNCIYRHWLYNKCVEILKKIQVENDTNKFTINKYDLLGVIRNTYEFTSIHRPDYLDEYDYYFRGISECVVDDIDNTCERIITERTKGKSSDLRFREYDPNNISFRFKNKINKSRALNVYGAHSGTRILLDSDPYILGLRINNRYSKQNKFLWIELKEPFDKFHLDLNEIKEVAIKFHNEKWHLCLLYKCYDFPKIKKSKRNSLAGIDVGEINPVAIYDGKPVTIPKHLRFPKDKLEKMETRLSRLQRVLDQKYNPEMDKFHQSKNYYKVLAKFHKLNERIVNIRKDWHFKLAHWIVTHYNTIVVDEFRDHIITKDREYLTTKRKRFNHSMLRRGMHDFIERLIYMSLKYGTNYYKPHKSLETTNTCSKCGNVNVHKLTLDERKFKCEHCDLKRDRDVNAAINCYNAYPNNTTI